MNEVLRRKMFNKVMNANQPAGILASSPEMVDTVQRRANGGSYRAPTSNILSNALRSIRGLPTIRQAGNTSGAGMPEFTGISGATSMQRQSQMGDAIFGGIDTPEYLRFVESIKGLPYAQQVKAMQEAGYGSSLGSKIEDTSSIFSNPDAPDVGMLGAVKDGKAISLQELLGGTGEVARPKTTGTQTRTASGVDSLLGPEFKSTDPRTDAAMAVSSPRADTSADYVNQGDPRYRPGTVPTASYGEDIVDDEYSTGVPETPGETIAATTTPTQESAKKDAEAETSSSKAATFTPVLDAETIEGLTEGSLNAEDEGKLVQSTGNAVIDQALSILQGETGAKTESQKAKAMDETLNIQGTRKERIQKRKEVLKELLGERAKDIRTDANYNLMMTGLMIAAGESPDVLTNVVKGLAVGLKGYAEAVGDEAQAVTKEDRGLMMQAASEVGAEISSEKAAALKAEQARVTRQHEERMQDRRLATSLVNTQLQVGSREALALAQIASREKLASNAFEQNLALFELKANQEEKIFDMRADLQRELATPDTETMRLMKAIQEEARADGHEMSDLEALATVKQAGAAAGKSTDTTNSYNRLVAAGMSNVDAWLLSQSGVVTEIIKDMGPEEFEKFIMSKLAQGGQQPQPISITSLTAGQQDKLQNLPDDEEASLGGVIYIKKGGSLVPK